MDREQVIFKLQHEYCILWRAKQYHESNIFKDQKENAINAGNVEQVKSMGMEVIEINIRMQELLRISNSLELDWATIKKGAIMFD